jgi:uncharacterized protein YqgC (DUF456 family)
MALFLLILAFAVGLVFLPFGLPGLWLMVAATGAYFWLGPQGAIGPYTLGGVIAIAVIAELAEFIVTARATKRAGGSSRGAWWALGGSLVGALAGVPVPIAGSLIGAFLGAFLGAWLAELSLGRAVEHATRAAKGAVMGRITAVALKIAAAVAIAAWVIGAIVYHASF